MPADSPDTTTVSDDDSSVDSSSHVETSEREEFGLTTQMKHDYNNDCDSVGPNAAESNPDP